MRPWCAVLAGMALAGASATAADDWCGNPNILWGRQAGIVPPPAADVTEQIVSRYSLAIARTFQEAAAKSRFGDKFPPGFLLGNGDATVSLRDARGRWVYTISPMDYWWGLTGGCHLMSHGLAGRIAIEIPELTNCPAYRMQQDIYRAELTGEFANGPAAVKMVTRVLRGTKLLAVSLSNTGSVPVTVLAELSTGEPYSDFSMSESGARDDILFVHRNGRMTADHPFNGWLPWLSPENERIAPGAGSAGLNNFWTAKTSPKSLKDHPEAGLFCTGGYGIPAMKLKSPNGACRVTLRFCELRWNQEGKSNFTVNVQGVPVAKRMDLFKAAGGQFKPLDISCDTTVTDGILTIALPGWGTSISAVVIEAADAAGGKTTKKYCFGQKAWQDYTAPEFVLSNPPVEEVVCYAGLATRILGSEYAVTVDKAKYKATASGVLVKPGQTVEVVTAFETSAVFPDNYTIPGIKAYYPNRTKDVVQPLMATLRSVHEKTMPKLAGAHREWWREFWGRSHIDVPSEPAIEVQWYGKLYTLACQTRVGQIPPGLVGWVERDKGVYAGDDHHLNWNIQFAFKGASAANHPEFMRCYADYLCALQPLFEQRAALRKMPGLSSGTGLVPFGWAYENDMAMLHNHADLAQPMITYYKHTRDDEFLKNKLYPFLRKTAENCDFLLKWETSGDKARDEKFDFKGRYVLKSAVAECDGRHMINPPSAIAFISGVYASLIEFSKVLGVDDGLRAGWQERLAKMSPIALVQANGLMCLSFSEDNPEIRANGMPYPLLGFAPGEYFDRESKVAEYARNFIKAGEWLDPKDGFITATIGPAVRSGYPIKPVLDKIRNWSLTVQPHYANERDNTLNDIQMLDGIGYMFLQTIGGRIVVFPNWDMTIDAGFHQLRTDGAFLVSARLKQGVIGSVMIRSEKGLPCRVQSPWPGRGVKVIELPARKDIPAAKEADGDQYRFATEAGRDYELVVDPK
jgi:hypothetical protein